MNVHTDTTNSASLVPPELLARDVHALEASWGCESALPFLRGDAEATADGHDVGAPPWQHCAATI